MLRSHGLKADGAVEELGKGICTRATWREEELGGKESSSR